MESKTECGGEPSGTETDDAKDTAQSSGLEAPGGPNVGTRPNVVINSPKDEEDLKPGDVVNGYVVSISSDIVRVCLYEGRDVLLQIDDEYKGQICWGDKMLGMRVEGFDADGNLLLSIRNPELTNVHGGTAAGGYLARIEAR